MRKWLLFVLLGFVSTTIAFAATWTSVSEPLIPETLNDIFFVSETNGYVVGNTGAIYFTADGGETWKKQDSTVKSNLLKVFFVGTQTGWVGTNAGSILLTTDGGQNWNEVSFAKAAPHITFSYFRSLYFVDKNVGHIIAGKSKFHYVMKTTDGGQTWAIKDSLADNSTQNWYDIEFYGEGKVGAIVGDKIYTQRYTHDGGETWAASDTIKDVNFRDLKAVRWLSETDVIAAGEGNDFWSTPTPFYKSTDGGRTWARVDQHPADNMDRAKDAYFFDSMRGIVVGSNGFSKCFTSKTSDGGESWTAEILPFDFGLQAISGVGAHMWALGTANHFLRTSDGGGSWELIPLKVPSTIQALQFAGDRGFAVGRYSDVLTSTDGTGKKWNFTSHAGIWDMGAADFVSEKVGYLVKENRHILKTKDGGETWQTVFEPVPFNSRNKVGGIDFVDAETGYAWVSLNDYAEYHIYKTTDGGENWTQVDSTKGPGYLSGGIGFFDADHGFAAGPDRWIRSTTDGGSTWTTDTLKHNFPSHISLKADANAVCVVDEDKAIIVGAKFICTTGDKGNSWSYVKHGVADIDSSFTCVAFAGPDLGYIGTSKGVVLKTSAHGTQMTSETIDGAPSLTSAAINPAKQILFGTMDGQILLNDTGTGVADKPAVQPVRFSLEQNYPNPFNASTLIKFEIASDCPVKLQIFDTLGRQTATLLDQSMNAGKHSITYDANDLPSGIYFYRLQAGQQVQLRKMTLVK